MTICLSRSVSVVTHKLIELNKTFMAAILEALSTIMIENRRNKVFTVIKRGWSGGAMVLGKLPVHGRPSIWISVGQGPTALAVGTGGDCLDIFTLIYPFSPLSPSF